MKVVSFILTAQQPLLLTSLQGDPNSSVSFDYIPGSALRGALIGRYCAHKLQDKDLDLADDTIQRLFFDHRTRYLNAYPVVADTVIPRALPLPRSLKRKKNQILEAGEPMTVYDLSVERPILDPDEQLTDLGTHAYGMLDRRRRIVPATVSKHINIHNQRDRPRGRGVEGNGAVFRYEAIAPGQRFQGIVLCDHDPDATEVQELLQSGNLWMGGSRSAGYGETRIDDVALLDAWEETGTQPNQRSLEAEIRLMLLSDLVNRNANGQYDASLPVAEIGPLLGMNEPQVIIERSFKTTTLQSGFNRTWGLPIPQTPVLAAGSVFVLKCEQAPTPEDIAVLEAHGLGDRRAEGYGRIAIEWPPRTAETTLRHIDDDVIAVADESEEPVLSESSAQLARSMARRMLEQQLEQALITLVDHNRISGIIANTQLSRLRIVARRAMSDPLAQRMQRVRKLLDHMPMTAHEQFEKARVGIDGRERLRLWLDQRLDDPFTDWPRNDFVVTVAGQTTHIDQELATRYTLRLIMAITRLAVKEVR